MGGLFSLCGFDSSLIAKVDAGERRFFVFSALVSSLSCAVAGLGFAGGAFLTVGAVGAPFAFVAAFLFVLNLLRLQHAGSGYPLHLPIEEIGRWRPATAGVVVLLVLGALVVQPLVFLLEKPWLDVDLARRAADALAVRQSLGLDDGAVVVSGGGLIARGRAAWDLHPLASGLLTLGLALVVAAPGLLRRFGAAVVRHYESERWITERIFVDDEWADARDVIESTLLSMAPGFSAPLTVPFADPPYNTRPLIFGLDPGEFVFGRLKYVRVARSRTAETPTVPTAAEPWWTTLSFSPTALPPVPTLTVPTLTVPTLTPALPPAVTPAAAPLPAPAPTTTKQEPTAPPTTTTKQEPALPWLPVTEVARLNAAVARTNPRVMALCSRYLEIPPGQVLAALQSAPDGAPLHVVFPAWSKLPTILLKRADLALQLGLAPLIAIAVERPVEQVERRLRAAVGESRVSAVFAPELTRLLLRSRVKTPS